MVRVGPFRPGPRLLCVFCAPGGSTAAAHFPPPRRSIPGTIYYRGARIQLLDMPGIIEGAKDGKGRGKQVISTARTCDVILIVLDASKPMTHKRIIERELEGFGIRLNKTPPNIVLTRKEKGGVMYRSAMPQPHLDEECVRAQKGARAREGGSELVRAHCARQRAQHAPPLCAPLRRHLRSPLSPRRLVKSICAEYKIHSCEIQVRQPNVTADDLIDVIEGNRKYIPCLYVLNKIDSITIEELDLLDRVPHYVPVSAHHEWNFDELLEKIWDYAGCIRIYTKPRSQVPDYTAPVVLRTDQRSMASFVNRIHRNLLKSFKHAIVWGRSVKHQPQRVGKQHVLEDEDIVQIVKVGSG